MEAQLRMNHNYSVMKIYTWQFKLEKLKLSTEFESCEACGYYQLI